jgi:RNA recognition motif-containing protein
VDEEILFELFLNAGPLQRVTIPKDRETKKARAYAFIGTGIVSHYIPF